MLRMVCNPAQSCRSGVAIACNGEDVYLYREICRRLDSSGLQVISYVTFLEELRSHIHLLMCFYHVLLSRMQRTRWTIPVLNVPCACLVRTSEH